LSQVNEIVEAVSAFSNTKGGKIIIGVSRTGKVLGIEIGMDTIEWLTNKIVNNTDPSITINMRILRSGNKSNLATIVAKPGCFSLRK
jgi:ATP-dependent DNA helicase RecG